MERETYIAQIIKDLYSKLEEAEIDSDIDGRPKHFIAFIEKWLQKIKV